MRIQKKFRARFRAEVAVYVRGLQLALKRVGFLVISDLIMWLFVLLSLFGCSVGV